MGESLSRAQLLGLAVLANGPARRSNQTDDGKRTIAHQTIAMLEARGLAVVVDGRATITDAGRAILAARPPVAPMQYEHGTYACYKLDRCRCVPCTTANREYDRQRRLDAAYGHDRLVDADPVREYVRDLMRRGVGRRAVANVAGLSHGTLSKLLYGIGGKPPTRRLKRETAQRLLAVTPADVPDGSLVPIGRTADRLRDMVADGATWAELGEQIGMRPIEVRHVLDRRKVRAHTARAIFALHERWARGQWEPEGPRYRKGDRHVG
jgi:hypothetical protein